MPIPLYQIDAFTAVPFKGNPAAVCLLEQPADEVWMQNVAAEMNLSETAFLYPIVDCFNLRWFTPTVEVPLCGHATLASAHALFETGVLQSDETARFHTKSGLLTATKNGVWIELNFPAQPVVVTEVPPNLARGLGCECQVVARNDFFFLIEAASEAIVRNLQPDFALLKTIPPGDFIVTAKAEGKEFDFVSRMFAPGVGINEDPVTGSAHCVLGPYWQERFGKNEFLAYQASARGGVVKVRVEGNRVVLGGQAVTVLKGELFAQ
jgi:predicted PhzF superfamily epimerase YddE/YHI9